MPKIPKINNISEDLRRLDIVSLDTLILDPENARKHPERNLEDIKSALSTFGQLQPLVVRKENRTIAAGNGRCIAMREMGWTEAAVTFKSMTDAEFVAYSLADNRVAESAKWDNAIVAKLDKFIQEASLPTIGWTDDELQVLRSADWVPPTVDEEADDGTNTGKKVSLKFSEEQENELRQAMDLMNDLRLTEDKEPLDREAVFVEIAKDWVDRKLQDATNN